MEAMPTRPQGLLLGTLRFQGTHIGNHYSIRTFVVKRNQDFKWLNFCKKCIRVSIYTGAQN